MRDIIDGAVYDTSTASKIAYWGNHLPGESGRNITEVLYRTPAGLYFLHGVGGCFTKYKHVDSYGCASEGEKVSPMPFAEAETWGREHLLATEYRHVFGRRPAGDGVDFRLSPKLLDALDTIAAGKGTTRGLALSACILDAAAKAKAEEVPPYRKVKQVRCNWFTRLCWRLKKRSGER